MPSGMSFAKRSRRLDSSAMQPSLVRPTETSSPCNSKPSRPPWTLPTRIETDGTQQQRRGVHGGPGAEPLDCGAPRESYGLVWPSLRRVEAQKHETRPEGRVTCRPEPGLISIGVLIFPENLASRQAESDRFRQRDCLACDPAI